MAELSMTIPLMESKDYKERMVAEYWQTKIRYEKLKKLNTRIKACDIDIHLEKPKCAVPKNILREQQAIMGRYLELLEIRAELEDIDLSQICVTTTSDAVTVSRRKSSYSYDEVNTMLTEDKGANGYDF